MVHHLMGFLLVTPRSHLFESEMGLSGFHPSPSRTGHPLSVVGPQAHRSPGTGGASWQSDCGGGQCAFRHREWVRAPGNVCWCWASMGRGVLVRPQTALACAGPAVSTEPAADVETGAGFWRRDLG